MMDLNNNGTGDNSHEQQQQLQSTLLGTAESGLSPSLSLNSEDLFDIRNCPTPDVSKLENWTDFINSYDPLDQNAEASDNDEIMSFFPNALKSEEGDGDSASAVMLNTMLNADDDAELAALAAQALQEDCTAFTPLAFPGQESPSTTLNALLGSHNNTAIANPLLHQSSSNTLLSSTASPFQTVNHHHHRHNNNNTFLIDNVNFLTHGSNNHTFVPIDEVRIKREEDNQTPVITSALLLPPATPSSEMQLITGAASTSKSGGGRVKEKCMTRNAILARQNREKKKLEQESMAGRMSSLEAENAGLKKKAAEYKTGMETAQDRVRYLEAVLQNVPQILHVIEHMSHLKPNPKGGGGGGGGSGTSNNNSNQT